MKHKTTQALYAYWNDLRGSRLAPRRCDIEPARMGDALPDTFILERQDAQTFPYRLAGTRLCERFKREFRGHNFLDIWPDGDRQKLKSRLNTVSVQGGVILVLAEAATAAGQRVPVEIMILPLVHGQPCADRFLGVLCPLDVPAWLGFDPIVSIHVLGDESIWPDGHPRPEPARDSDRQTPVLPRVRHCRLVRSDRRQFRVFEGGRGQPDRPHPSKS